MGDEIQSGNRAGHVTCMGGGQAQFGRKTWRALKYRLSY